MKRLWIAVLLSLAAIFALLAYASPVKSIPTYPACGDNMDILVAEGNDTAIELCTVQIKAYWPIIHSQVFPVWLYNSYGEIAEAFVVLALFSAILPRTGPENPPESTPIIRREGRYITFDFVRIGYFSVMLIGLYIFVTMLIGDIQTNIPEYQIVGSVSFVSFMDGTLRVASGSIAHTALAGLLSGALGFSLLQSKRGIRFMFSDLVLRYFAPCLFFLTAALLLLVPFSMADHFSASLKLWEGGIQPLSNWLVLIVSGFLTVIGSIPTLKRIGSWALSPFALWLALVGARE